MNKKGESKIDRQVTNAIRRRLDSEGKFTKSRPAKASDYLHRLKDYHASSIVRGLLILYPQKTTEFRSCS